jgi:hypothetical protein
MKKVIGWTVALLLVGAVALSFGRWVVPGRCPATHICCCLCDCPECKCRTECDGNVCKIVCHCGSAKCCDRCVCR